MPASTIIVQYPDGSPGSHVRVVLGFATGMTDDYYTDRYGKAVVEHGSTGMATLYVGGRKYDRFHAPGRVAVTLPR